MAKRRTFKARANRITPDAVAAWKAGDAPALQRALGLKPWEASPLECEGDCPWAPGTAGWGSWPKVAKLRAELEAANG